MVAELQLELVLNLFAVEYINLTALWFPSTFTYSYVYICVLHNIDSISRCNDTCIHINIYEYQKKIIIIIKR